MIRLFLAIFYGKIIAFIIRFFGKGGGSAAPGLIALKIDPQLIQKLTKQIPKNVLITGTNGKTTTSAMLAHFLVKSGTTILHNTSGSNLTRGVASKLISASSLFGKIKNVEVGIWEADEAAFVELIEQIEPQHIIVLNISRDQLDRYGEINTILAKWKKALLNAQWHKNLYLNGDDAHVYELKNIEHTRVQIFGIENSPIHFEKQTKNPTYDVKARVLENLSPLRCTGTTFVFSYDGLGKKVTLPVAGIYNIYNFLAAYSVAVNLGVSSDTITSHIDSFVPAFGRMEKILLGKVAGLIALIKNPTGATEVIQTIVPQMKKGDAVLIILNDNIADGADVSWIWDTNFELFKKIKATYYVTGTRRYDMALRLYYAGIEKERIVVGNEISPLVTTSLGRDDRYGKLFILPTYTALLELQKYLKENDYKERHWYE